jgi:hypothetical protein
VATEIASEKRIRILSGTDIRSLMELEAGRQVIGCDAGQTSCLAELAGAMGARFVIHGRVGTLGSLMVLELAVLDTTEASSSERVVVKATSVEGFADGLGAPAKKLRAPVLLTVHESRPTEVNEPGIEAASPVTTTERSVLSWALVASGGSLLALSGGAAALSVGAAGLGLYASSPFATGVIPADLRGPFQATGAWALPAAGALVVSAAIGALTLAASFFVE